MGEEHKIAKRVVELSMQLANSRADVENLRMRIKAVDKEHEQLKKDRADMVDRFDAALRRAKAEGLKEAEQYALNCVKELQDKIKDIELGKYTLVGAQTKEGVAEWVHAKTLQASRIAKWITARIAEVEDDARAAQIEKGEHDDSHTSND